MIIRSQSQIATASTADLIETYNAMTGKSIKKFSSRAAGESQVANALLAAANAAGQLGVKRGHKPEPMTVAEIEAAKAAKAAKDAPPSHDVATSDTIAPAPTQTPKRRLRDVLAAKASDAEPFRPKPRAERAATSKPRQKISAVIPTFAGRTRLHPNSNRNTVLVAINTLYSASNNSPVPVEAIEAHVGYPVGGYIGKLIVTGHVVSAPTSANADQREVAEGDAE